MVLISSKYFSIIFFLTPWYCIRLPCFSVRVQISLFSLRKKKKGLMSWLRPWVRDWPNINTAVPSMTGQTRHKMREQARRNVGRCTFLQDGCDEERCTLICSRSERQKIEIGEIPPPPPEGLLFLCWDLVVEGRPRWYERPQRSDGGWLAAWQWEAAIFD